MPTYEYECRTCGYIFERVQNMSDDPVKDCPECGQAVRRNIFGGSGVIFKGSGFYVNDSRGKNPAAPSSSKSNSGDSSASPASASPAAGTSAAGPAPAGAASASSDKKKPASSSSGDSRSSSASPSAAAGASSQSGSKSSRE